MNTRIKTLGTMLLSAAVLLSLWAVRAEAAIDGVVSGTGTFNLTAKTGQISTPDGSQVFMWGFAHGTGVMQYPGPTLIVDQGQLVTINLTNQLTVPVSIVFPGQTGVTASGLTSTPGLLTREAPPGGSVTYTFTASQPGTYTYYSGTMPELQVEMGLVGAIIVRPAGFNPLAPTAYGATTPYDREFLFLLSEIDPAVHSNVMLGNANLIDYPTARATFWFINGRALPDTMLPAAAAELPNQPYNSAPQMRVGEQVLVRMIGAGRDMHPLHLHGNHHKLIARDGRLLSTNGIDADLAEMRFTNTVAPGQTYDAIFTWTGDNLGWDLYGHSITGPTPDPLVQPGGGTGPGDEIFVQTTLNNFGGAQLSINAPAAGSFPSTSGFRAVIWDGVGTFPGGNYEVVRLKRDLTTTDTYTITQRGLEGTTEQGWNGGDSIVYTDHGRPVPVIIPSQEVLTNGMFWSGSPFLGTAGQLPPGEGGFNPNSGFFFMWHSHNEKELTNNDIFPGGLATMMVVEHPDPLIAPFSDIPILTPAQ